MIRWIVVLVAVWSLGASLPNPPSGLAASAPTNVQVLPWSGILSPARAADWSTVGVLGGIPSATYTQSGATITAGSGKTTEIQDALNACSGGKYVQLGAGTFSNLGGLTISTSGCVLRGMGADQTFLVFSSDNASPCRISWATLQICTQTESKTKNVSWSATPCLATASCQGVAQITLASYAGLTVGDPIFLGQDDDTADGWPAAGDTYACATTSCSAQGATGGYAPYAFDDHSSMGTYYKVLACGSNSTVGTACNNGTVTITPGITVPTYRSGKNPVASWASHGTWVQNSGIENLSYDWTNAGGASVGFASAQCFNCWLKGIRSVANFVSISGSNTFHITLIQLGYFTIRDSYLFGPTADAGQAQVYPIIVQSVGGVKIENNIIQRQQAALIPNGAITNSVLGYNFFPGRQGPMVTAHTTGYAYMLHEGNLGQGFYGDINHGHAEFLTFFRNGNVGKRFSNSYGTRPLPFMWESFYRFINMVANVSGDPLYTNYERDCGVAPLCTAGTNLDPYIYVWGWMGGEGWTANDAHVKRTAMRWWNWDSVTAGANRGTDGDQTGTRKVAGEVPSGITNFANAPPSAVSLPASFYLSAKPAWWTTGMPWPGIGPDVSGGTNASTVGYHSALSNLGGHVFLNPAARCYFSVMGGQVDGQGEPLSFNAATCYGAGGN